MLAPAAVVALPPAPPGVVIEQNVSYLAPGRTEKLDLYLPADRPEGTRSPAVVIIHGGGWSSGDKAAGREFNIGTTLAKAGYVRASLNYTLAGPKPWPNNLFDCKNGVRFLRANAAKYGVDVEHIGVIGGSAGGHLVLMVGLTTDIKELESDELYPGVSDRVSCVVDMYGITDLRTLKQIDPDGTPNDRPKTGWNQLFGVSADTPDAAEKLKAASPVAYLTPKSPPVLILHGTTDTTVDRDQSKQLDRALAEVGVEHKLVMIEGIGHTFDLQKWGGKPLPEDLRPLVTAFFDKHLKPSAKKEETAEKAEKPETKTP